MTLRWPEHAGWDALAETMEVLAEACGVRAQCERKYDYLRVELHGTARTDAQMKALHFMADCIELISDREGSGLA